MNKIQRKKRKRCLFIFLAILIASFLLFPHPVYTHPGKTDYRGGHKCWKNCGEWELMPGEYHLHDKDWRPIRIDKKGNPAKEIRPYQIPATISKDQPDPAQPDEMNKPLHAEEKKAQKTAESEKTIHKRVYKPIVYEENMLPFNRIMLLILAFLLLLTLILIRKKANDAD